MNDTTVNCLAIAAVMVIVFLIVTIQRNLWLECRDAGHTRLYCMQILDR